MKTWFNKNAIHLAIIGLFAVLCFIYFPSAWQGKELYQHDVLQAKAGQKEILDIQKRDGDLPLWTNSMFGGMPTYQVLIDLPSNVGTYIMRAFKTVFPHPIDVVLLYFLGAYLLFNVLRVRPWLAALGAIAFAFTSYNFIYIEAGHSSKAYAIAFLAPILAGILLTFRGNYVWGAVILAFSMALEIRVNHIQVPYYMFIGVLLLIAIELYHAYKQKTLPTFGKAIAVQAVTLVLAIAVNASLLWPTYEYSQLSTRGKSNLTAQNALSKPTQGVDKEYAYQWSQGIGESITFLIPNAYGGGFTTQVKEDGHLVKLLQNNGASKEQAIAGARSLPTYWGEKPFTSGPWYFGASIVFLFILGLIFVKGRFKWWLAGSSLLFLLLAFGRHFPYVSDLFFNYFPMYNKFRAVESTLIILSLLVPILAVLGLNEVITAGDKIKDLPKKVLIVFGSLAAICLIIALVPDLLLSFKGSSYPQILEGLAQQIGDRSFAEQLTAALVKDRAALASADAFRSLIILTITFGLVWFMIKNKLNHQAGILLIAGVVLIDLWTVDKRYLNETRFVEPLQLNREFNALRQVDELILMDKNPNYRVFDLTTNPFQDARTSYYHKSIGGYHAAKLMRYQELIENHLSQAFNEDVLDMLNVRYAIVAEGQSGNQRIQRRESAAGNAWFVDRVNYVNTNDDEMKALSSFDPKKEAFVHESFKQHLDNRKLRPVQNASIQLTSYRPDHLVYEYSSPSDGFAVFSEIWYDKGWKAFVDGEEYPIIRANYVLRGLQLPGGNHTVEFKFEPASYHVGEIISLIASIILVLGAAFAIWRGAVTRKETR
jgi:hypothetical protein